jgi:zinc transporter 5/7
MADEYPVMESGAMPQVQLNDEDIMNQFSIENLGNSLNNDRLNNSNHEHHNLSNNRFEIDETNRVDQINRGVKFDLTRFIGTLPILVAFPSLLLSYTLSYTTPSIDIHSIILLVVFANTFLTLFKLASRLRIININHENDDFNQQALIKSIITLISLSIVYFSTKLLSIDRIVILCFGFYLNQYNFYTLIAFCLDIYNCHPNNIFQTVLGYILLFVAGKLLMNYFNQNHHFISSISLSFLLTIEVFGVFLLLILFDYKNLNFSIIGVNIAVSAVSLFSLVDANLKSSKLLLLILSSISIILQYIILSTPFTLLSILNVFLPLVISIDRSNDISSNNASSNQATNNLNSFNSIIKELLSHSDTKAIFNFLLLNATFMFIQLLYSFRSKSLGLLSDSLHMALDCTSLALGLLAGVLSKQSINPNGKYPFGLKNFEILAGFTNGTLLIGISGSIIFEAIGRLINPVSLQKTNELIIVSILGLLVNLVGIFAFNHGHDHSHGHSHGHSHQHSHQHSQDHSHHTSSADANGHCSYDLPLSSQESSTMNDNMKGIFLHILADTLGSVGVVASTLLTKVFGWDGFDPIASIIIAMLIFFSAVPLIRSTSSTLLLQLDSKKENDLRDVLNEILTVKGVKSFTTPRFWPGESKLQGYIHIQIYRDENSNYIKKQCQKWFDLKNIDVMIQMEHDYDDCWCRRNTNRN